jgi:hypothetical protein
MNLVHSALARILFMERARLAARRDGQQLLMFNPR